MILLVRSGRAAASDVIIIQVTFEMFLIFLYRQIIEKMFMIMKFPS